MILALLTQQEKNLDKAQGLLSWDLSVLCSVRVSVEEGCAALTRCDNPWVGERVLDGRSPGAARGGSLWASQSLPCACLPGSCLLMTPWAVGDPP